MCFEINQEIANDIIFAMENQNERFLFDSKEEKTVVESAILPNESGAHALEKTQQRYYQIPEWDSVSGFRMMERFVGKLKNPLVREELRVVLNSGQGVFKGFKAILKDYPELERQWFRFKTSYMHDVVYEWYNVLRESWGLERIGTEPEETDDIIKQDFIFRNYCAEDEQAIDVLLSAYEFELERDLELGLSAAIIELYKMQVGLDSLDETLIVVESIEGEVVGVAISNPFPSGSFMSAQISIIIVFEEYRGMGLGKELLQRTISHWTQKGFRWLLCNTPLISEAFIAVMNRYGFVDRGQIFVLDLTTIDD